ncbi:DUF4259 domain-containing protein [Streptomyces sp. NPDC016459]|uniref:DUF4259 domain-containing protein n=1 Tax=Streptomyces sp. NPDC016459 TaxID=3157190 RepID=UPI0033D00C1B
MVDGAIDRSPFSVGFGRERVSHEGSRRRGVPPTRSACHGQTRRARTQRAYNCARTACYAPRAGRPGPDRPPCCTARGEGDGCWRCRDGPRGGSVRRAAGVPVRGPGRRPPWPGGACGVGAHRPTARRCRSGRRVRPERRRRRPGRARRRRRGRRRPGGRAARSRPDRGSRQPPPGAARPRHPGPGRASRRRRAHPARGRVRPGRRRRLARPRPGPAPRALPRPGRPQSRRRPSDPAGPRPRRPARRTPATGPRPRLWPFGTATELPADLRMLAVDALDQVVSNRSELAELWAEAANWPK